MSSEVTRATISSLCRATGSDFPHSRAAHSRARREGVGGDFAGRRNHLPQPVDERLLPPARPEEQGQGSHRRDRENGKGDDEDHAALRSFRS